MPSLQALGSAVVGGLPPACLVATARAEAACCRVGALPSALHSSSLGSSLENHLAVGILAGYSLRQLWL